MNPLLSVVLPCYNEEKNISTMLERYSRISRKIPMELVLVDNGSTDGTEAVLKRCLPKYRFARSVKVKKNVGYGFGIFTGLKAARGEFLAYSHADMQCDPQDVIKSWDMLSGRRNVLVKGRRQGRSNFFTSCFHAASVIIFFRKFRDINGQPKMFHNSLMKNLVSPPYDFSFDFYVYYTAVRNGFSVEDFPVRFRNRVYGKSSWDLGFVSRLRSAAKYFSYLLRLRLSGN